MPDPVTVARRSIRHARLRGMTHGQAAWRIISICRSVRRWIDADCPEFSAWLAEVEAACWDSGKVPAPPDTSRQEH